MTDEKATDVALPTPPTRTVMIEGVWLEQFRYNRAGEGTIFEWQVQNLRFNNLTVRLDFTGTENFDLGEGPVKTATIQAYETKKVATIRQLDPHAAFTLSYAWNIGTSPPDDAALEAAVKEDRDVIEKSMQTFDDVDLTGDPSVIPINELRAVLNEAKVAFVDTDFPPTKQSIIVSGPPNKYGAFVTWRRAQEFMKRVALFEDGVDPLDIQQGQLGNCWFCSGLACLAEHPKLVQRVFLPLDTGGDFDCGAYRLRVCKDGHWSTITLDDYFPCFPKQGPIFSKNRGDELWVLLCEKAFAKIHGCYDNLRSGRTVDALADLTGFPIRYYNFNDDDTQALIKAGKMWDLIVDTAAQDQMVAAGTAGEDYYSEFGVDPENDAGLVTGHAYSVLHAQEALGKRLIKLRNPWGRFEWTGDWSDTSDLWTEEAKAVFQPEFSPDDGIFWMSYDDFLKYFDTLHVCYWHSGSNAAWHARRAEGSFVRNEAVTSALNSFASASPTAYYKITITQKTSASIGIYQEDKRLGDAEPYIDMGLWLCKVDLSSKGPLKYAEAEVQVIADTDLVTTDRQVHARTPELEPGEYWLIPYSSGAKMMHTASAEREFMVVIHTDDKSASKLQSIPVALTESSGNTSAAQLHNKALQSIIRANAKQRDCGEGVTVYSLWSGPVITYAVEIRDDAKEDEYEITLNCSKSENAISNHDNNLLELTQSLTPGEFRVFHRLAPIDDFEPYRFSYTMSWTTFEEGSEQDE